MLTFFEIVGACVTVYVIGDVGLRVVATAVDIYLRWRDDDWEIDDAG